VAELVQNRIAQGINRGWSPASQVEDCADRFRLVETGDPRSHDIIDKDEIS
jgi:hypothetical protein